MNIFDSLAKPAASLLVVIGTTTILHAQYMPPVPAAPTSYDECNAYRNAVNQLETEMRQEHEACLTNHTKEQGNPNASGPVCSHAACQNLHDYVYGDKAKYMDEEANQCNQEVSDYLARNRAWQQQQQQQQQAWQQQQQIWEQQQQAAQAAAQQKQLEAVQKTEARNDAIKSASDSFTTLANMLGLGSGKDRNSGKATTLETDSKQSNTELAKTFDGDPNDFAKDFSPMMKPDIPAIIKAGISSTGPEGEAIVDTYEKIAGAKENVDAVLSLPSLWNGFINGDSSAQFTVMGGAAQKAAEYGASNPLQKAIMERGIETVMNVYGHAFGDLDNAFQVANQGIFSSSFTSYNSSTPVYQVGYITVTEPDIADLPSPTAAYAPPSSVVRGEGPAFSPPGPTYSSSDSDPLQEGNCSIQSAAEGQPKNSMCNPGQMAEDGGANAFSQKFGVAK